MHLTRTDNRLQALLCLEDSAFNERITMSAEIVSLIPTSEADLKVGDIVEVLDAATNTWIMAKITQSIYSINWICNDGHQYHPENVRHPRVPDLSKLKKEIQQNRGEELAIFPSYQVFSNIVRRNVKKWEVSMNDLAEFYVNETQSLCRNASTALNLPKCLSNLLQTTALKCIKDLRRDTVLLLRKELDKEYEPFTLNHYLYDNLIKLVFYQYPSNSP
jgi:hypothetical protein